jgi:hypothetical protein
MRTHEELIDGSDIIRKSRKRHFQILGAHGAYHQLVLDSILRSQETAGREQQKMSAGKIE